MISLFQFAFIDGVGGPELVLILIVALVLFGGKGLPNVARTLGKTVREFKKATQGIEAEIKKAMDEVEDEVSSVKESVKVTRPKLLSPELGLPGHSAAAVPEEAEAADGDEENDEAADRAVNHEASGNGASEDEARPADKADSA